MTKGDPCCCTQSRAGDPLPDPRAPLPDWRRHGYPPPLELSDRRLLHDGFERHAASRMTAKVPYGRSRSANSRSYASPWAIWRPATFFK